MMTPRTCIYVLLTSLVFAVAHLAPLASQSLGDAPKKKDAKEAMIEWGPEMSGIRCSVALPSKEKIFAGEPVHVIFLTKNFGAKPATIVIEGPPLSVYTLRVVGPNGKPVPLTSYGRQQMDSAGDGSRSTEKIEPGKEDKSALLLSRIFDMTQKGDYKVSFSRSIWLDKTEAKVTSNILTVTVNGEKAEYVPN